MTESKAPGLSPVLPSEAESVEAMARAIWPAVYSGIISAAQITYMLDWMYTPETIRTEIEEKGVSWFWIESANERVGFAAGGPLTEDGNYPLHKIYLLPEVQGTGLGSLTMNELSARVKAQGGKRIRLRVNRGNTVALDFYGRNGFKLIKMDRADIGSGFVMDDCLLARDL
ncbi:GNAT family N-acetyltransferase [Verrucomicrobiales bacterium BCK34]|nr:GNAT family N-acetyltransferase [Verrucomicrobiales bacterium BCK34]